MVGNVLENILGRRKYKKDVYSHNLTGKVRGVIPDFGGDTESEKLENYRIAMGVEKNDYKKHYPKPKYCKCNKGHTLVEVYNEDKNAYVWDCPTCIEKMKR